MTLRRDWGIYRVAELDFPFLDSEVVADYAKTGACLSSAPRCSSLPWAKWKINRAPEPGVSWLGDAPPWVDRSLIKRIMKREWGEEKTPYQDFQVYVDRNDARARIAYRLAYECKTCRRLRKPFVQLGPHPPYTPFWSLFYLGSIGENPDFWRRKSNQAHVFGVCHNCAKIVLSIQRRKHCESSDELLVELVDYAARKRGATFGRRKKEARNVE